MSKRVASLTDSIIQHVELQLIMKGAINALIEACKFFYKLEDRPVRCTILAITEEMSKTSRGRVKLKGTKAITTIIEEFDRRVKANQIVNECDLTKFIESKDAKGGGDASMVYTRPE